MISGESGYLHGSDKSNLNYSEKYKPLYNRVLLYYLSIFTLIYIFYSYYENSLFVYQFLLFWLFIVMNLDKITWINKKMETKLIPQNEGRY